MKTTTTKPGWSAIRRQLVARKKPALLALMKELYDAAPVNRDLLHARLLAGAGDGELLEKYRRKIVEQFYPARGFGKLKLGEARQAIRDFRKATASVPGTTELLMSYVENGVSFTSEFGDIDERFYSSIESALKELAALLRGAARELYPQFAERLAKIERMSNGIGWGFHDYIAEVVSELEEDLGASL